MFTLSTFSSTGMIGTSVALLLLLVLLRFVFAQNAFWKHLTIIDLLVLDFYSSAVLSTAFSSYLHTSVVGLAKSMVFLAGYVSFRVINHVSILRQHKKPLYILLGLLALLGLIQSLIGFYQFANHIEPLATWVDPSINPELKMTRVFGTLQPSNPNLLAGFLIPCFASAVGLSLIALRKSTWLFSIISMAVAGAILYALVLTGSRGAYLAIGGMLAAWFAIVGHMLWHDDNLKSAKQLKVVWLIILIGSIGAIALAVLSSEQLQHRIASIFAMRDDSSIAYRLNVYNSVFGMIKHNWLVGIGPGNETFKLVYGLYMVPGYNALGAYSVPLEIAVEQGIIGVLIFGLLLVSILIRSILGIDSSATHNTLGDKFLLGLLFTGILGSIIYGFFDTIWYRPAVNLPFWFFVAAFAVQSERMLAPDEHR